jgi:hypothetical protein
VKRFTSKIAVSTTAFENHEPDAHFKKNTMTIKEFWFYIIAGNSALEKNIMSIA